MKTIEKQVLAELKRSKPQKKRVTFFISEDAKEALASWCQEQKVKESPAIEEMIRAMVPERYFPDGRS